MVFFMNRTRKEFVSAVQNGVLWVLSGTVR